MENDFASSKNLSYYRKKIYLLFLVCKVSSKSMSDHSRFFFVKRSIIILAYLSIFNHLFVSIYLYISILLYKEWKSTQRLINFYYFLERNTAIIQQIQSKNNNQSKLGNNVIYKILYIDEVIYKLYIK